MSLPQLLSPFALNNDKQRNEWTFWHADHHSKMAAQLVTVKRLTLPNYILDPIRPEYFLNWLQYHQDLHNRLNNSLNVIGRDISWFDVEKQESLASWQELNFLDHRQWQNILGLPSL